MATFTDQAEDDFLQFAKLHVDNPTAVKITRIHSTEWWVVVVDEVEGKAFTVRLRLDEDGPEIVAKLEVEPL